MHFVIQTLETAASFRADDITTNGAQKRVGTDVAVASAIYIK